MSPIPVFGCQFQKKSCADAFAEFHKVDHAEQVMFEQLEVAAFAFYTCQHSGVGSDINHLICGPKCLQVTGVEYRHVLSGFLVACVSPT
jgi:hypothetical protein